MLVTLRVIGEQPIHCAGCENAIQRALSQMPGVRQVRADHCTQRIDVRLEPVKTTAQVVQQRLEALGYQTELAEPAQTT
jgi:copper chaperone CopZ